MNYLSNIHHFVYSFFFCYNCGAFLRKYRCGSGRLKGKTVTKPAACFKPVDMKKRFTLARTKAKMGARMKRKAKMTRRMNPASKRLKVLNRR